MRLVLAPFDLNDPNDPDWILQPKAYTKEFSAKARKSPFGQIEYELEITNHGLGADWPTATLVVSSIAGAVVFLIPETHKRLRESIEEWKRIKESIEALIDWISRPHKPIQYPVELLYLDALTLILENSNQDMKVVFVAHSNLPVSTELSGSSTVLEHHLFTFLLEQDLIQVAIDSNRKFLWSTRIKSLDLLNKI